MEHRIEAGLLSELISVVLSLGLLQGSWVVVSRGIVGKLG